MKNPYEVLGVDENATDEEIKAAYRALVKKYHPDNFADSPLVDVANEKMQEINEAYDAVISGSYRRQSGSYRQDSYDYGGFGGYGERSYGYSRGEKDSPLYRQIRASISQRRFDEADMALNGVPLNERHAEWNYLKGQVAYNKGRFEQAVEYFTAAYNMEPDDEEYRRAYANMGSASTGGFRTSSRGEKSDCDFCSACQGLLCADCCCECMGGDLVPCC